LQHAAPSTFDGIRLQALAFRLDCRSLLRQRPLVARDSSRRH
jgi:hypothetical protein